MNLVWQLLKKEDIWSLQTPGLLWKQVKIGILVDVHTTIIA